MTKTILILAIAVAFVAGTIATGSLIYAQGPPSEPPGVILSHVEGAGTGTLTCANGDVFNNVLTTVILDPTGERQAFVSLRNLDNTRQQHFGALLAGESTQSAYNLNGLFSFREGDFICEETPAVVTVSGDCGIGVAITIVAPGSMTGAFVGNVACV